MDELAASLDPPSSTKVENAIRAIGGIYTPVIVTHNRIRCGGYQTISFLFTPLMPSNTAKLKGYDFVRSMQGQKTILLVGLVEWESFSFWRKRSKIRNHSFLARLES